MNRKEIGAVAAHCTPMRASCAVLGVAALLIAAPALAGGTGPPCHANEVRAGIVWEFSPRAGVSWDVQLTKADGTDVGPPHRLVGMPNPAGGTFGRLDVTKDDLACDARNITILPPPVGVPPRGAGPGGAHSVFSIETIFFDPVLAKYYLGSNFDELLSIVAPNTMVMLPDLFADTNGDGIIGPDDVLYSLVDLPTYLLAIPSFNYGDTFTIVNGMVAGLPDMFFSTTPFVFSPDTGFTGTPANMMAEVFTAHGLTSVPEPDTGLLTGLGMLAAAVMSRLRRGGKQRQRA